MRGMLDRVLRKHTVALM